jgi:hypothetical protein
MAFLTMFESVTRVHARSSPAPFLPQIEPFERLEIRREASRVSFLMCPFCVRGALLAWATPTSRALGRGWDVGP